MTQHAVSVVSAPLQAVERTVRDVENWPRFLRGVERVVETSFGRYTFVLRDASGAREVDVAVTAHPGEHRIVWHALAGPRFDGEIRLTEVDDRHTRVSLSITAEPAGFLASLSDFARLGAHSTVELDLQRLDALATGTAAS